MKGTKGKATPSRRTKTCDKLDRMFAWLDGELTPAKAGAIEDHLSTCDRCGGLAEDLRRAIAACRLAGDCRIPAAVHRRARARARKMVAGGRRR
jgi:anti-sigma factor RsiW